jgi:hypothetical protein
MFSWWPCWLTFGQWPGFLKHGENRDRDVGETRTQWAPFLAPRIGNTASTIFLNWRWVYLPGGIPPPTPLLWYMKGKSYHQTAHIWRWSSRMALTGRCGLPRAPYLLFYWRFLYIIRRGNPSRNSQVNRSKPSCRKTTEQWAPITGAN